MAGEEPAGKGTVPVESGGLFLVTVGGPSRVGNGGDVVKSRFPEDDSGSSLRRGVQVRSTGQGRQRGRCGAVPAAAGVLGRRQSRRADCPGCRL